MKILVVSDTHGETDRLFDVLKSVKGHISAVIHAGDYEGDAAEIVKKYPDLPVYAVCGNCDYGKIMPPVKLIELGSKRIFITHGHRYDVNYSLMKLAYTAMQNEADIAVFGHTHIPLVEKYEGLTIVNPGSLSRPRGGSKNSYAVIDIDDNGKIDIKLVEYK
jgi:hypothetical protein